MVSLNIKWTKNFITIQISLKRTISEKMSIVNVTGSVKERTCNIPNPGSVAPFIMEWPIAIVKTSIHTYHYSNCADCGGINELYISLPHMFNVTRSNWCLSDWYSLYVFGAVTFVRLCLCFPDCQSIKKYWWTMYAPDLLAANMKKWYLTHVTMSLGKTVLSWFYHLLLKCIFVGQIHPL